MDNRRQDYRCSFPAASLLAECELACGALRGEIVDLSVRGMKVRISDGPAHLELGQPVRVRFTLPGESSMEINGTLVHGPHENHPVIGLRFLPLPDASADEARERILWTFLLGEQWKQRRLELAKLHG